MAPTKIPAINWLIVFPFMGLRTSAAIESDKQKLDVVHSVTGQRYSAPMLFDIPIQLL
jgi:hypothetical protein